MPPSEFLMTQVLPDMTDRTPQVEHWASEGEAEIGECNGSGAGRTGSRSEGKTTKWRGQPWCADLVKPSRRLM